MKVTLENLRIAQSSLSDRVYAGELSKDGNRWIKKTDITDDFISAVIAKFNGFETVISDEDGKKYKILVSEIS